MKGGGAYDYMDRVFFILYCSNKPCQSVLTDSQKEITAPLAEVRGYFYHVHLGEPFTGNAHFYIQYTRHNFKSQQRFCKAMGNSFVLLL